MIQDKIKVMLDSNIIISAIYRSNGYPYEAYIKASNPPYSLVLSDQIILEVHRICHRKFPHKVNDMYTFLCIVFMN